MKRLTTATLALAFGASLAVAQNPIIRDQFTADPTARVFNGRVYVYPSHDIVPPEGQRQDWFCMEDYHVFSSENLVDWTDHGMILTQNRIPWVEPNSYSMWAPECVEKNGRYYYYFPSAPKAVDGQRRGGFAIGVAIAEKPEGPFMPMPRPIDGVSGIDPCVLIDNDGSAYIYWSGMGIRGAKLKDNMMEVDGEPTYMEFPAPPAGAGAPEGQAPAQRPRIKVVGQNMDGLPDGFKEGPHVFRRGDWYYLTFPWVRVDNGTETLAYAMSKNPLGPWDFKGIFMAEHANGCWTNHHSFIEYKGQWYLFYHHNDYSPHFDKNRAARADKVFFNEDGTIQEVKPTERGVGISKATQRIEIDRYSELSPKGAKIDYLDTTNYFAGWKVLMDKGGWVSYNDVDFSEAATTLTARVRSQKGGKISVLVADKEVAVINVPKGGEWKEVTATVANLPQGVQNIMVKQTSGSAEIDWLGFGCLPWSKGGFETGKYRNFFAELGHTEAEVEARLNSVFNDVFVNEKTRCYFEVGDDMAYISDVKNNDVRTEGMSYGLMIAVQLDKKDIFDRLWRWSKKYMQHQDGDLKGYFAWSLKTDGTRNSQGPASDGELYYVTSLIFAGNRWGNDGEINYLAEAQNILNCSMAKTGMDNTAPFINVEKKLITFTPDRWGGSYTDPSYHLPAFYEVWAKWANDGRSQFWKECAAASREYLHKSIHPTTGLNPDYNNYDGSLMNRRGIIGDAFRYDSWRVPMNIALDYSWACADGDWQRQYANTIQGFFYKEGIDTFVDQYNIDGTRPTNVLRAGQNPPVLRHSLGLVATTAAVSLVATDSRAREFAQRLWDSKLEPYEDGFIDVYYDSLLRLFAFMHLSGRYQAIAPAK